MISSSHRVESALEVGARLEASLPATFRGDIVLPGQYYDIVGRKRWQDGEYRLAFAVLADAIASYYKYKGAKSRKGRLLFEEVRLWMHSHSRNGVFAFRNLCEMLGIDPDALMDALEKGRDLGEPALREIRVWRGKPRRGMSASSSGNSSRRRAVRRHSPSQAVSL
ncbi:MAG TPA: hypothetical protein VKB84_01095 [Candidatus Binataceae bacterium]|nr:hypothetical protein [Candidatus Binataceae bacterium]